MDRNTKTETPEVVEPEVIKPEVARPEPIQPEIVASTVPAQKSGGKGKWIACCLFLVLLCCCCTVATSYITFFKTIDAIKFVAKSDKNTNLTYITPAEAAIPMDWNQYVEQYPPKLLGNGTNEAYLTEKSLLMIFLSDTDYNSMADYIGLKITKDLMVIQIDAGSIMAEEIKQGNQTMPEGFNFNPEDLRGVYLNIELTTTPDHKEVKIKSIKIGDSFLDMNTFFPDLIKQIEDEVRKSDAYVDMKEIEFQDGKVRMIVTDKTTTSK
jgi:hypothetical protein